MLYQIILPTALYLMLSACNVKQTSPPVTDLPENTTRQACEWCGTGDAPATLSWETTIAAQDERGERMRISGTVYQADGTTPAEGVIMYVYHTNQEGIYPKRGDETGNGPRHGYLRGWMKTNALGEYAYETIRPAPYKTHGGEPAHVHYTLEAPHLGYEEFWVASVWFADDPRVTPEQLDRVQRQGGFNSVVSLSKNGEGLLVGERNIRLTHY